MTEREKELKGRGPADLNSDELTELYKLQITSATQEVAVRDRHLALLSKNVEDARAIAAKRHKETLAYGALSHNSLAPHAPGQSLCYPPASFASFD